MDIIFSNNLDRQVKAILLDLSKPINLTYDRSKGFIANKIRPSNDAGEFSFIEFLTGNW